MLVAVIGTGGIAHRAYLPVLGTTAGLDLILCSRRIDSVRQAQAEYRISRGTTDLEDVIRARPQAAFVLTPNAAHVEAIPRLLEAGIDVFVEKPAALHSQQTRALAELAERQGRILMVGFNRRFAPLHRQAKDLVDDKPADLAWFQKDRTSSAYASLFAQYIDDTIHQVDLLRFFCGEAEPVSTRAVSSGGKIVSSTAVVALESGGTGVIATSFQAGAWRESYILSGGGQSLVVEAFMRLALSKHDPQNTPFGGNQGERRWQEPYDSSWRTNVEARGFKGQIEAFFDCVRTRSQPETGAWDALKTQLLLEGIVDRAVVVDRGDEIAGESPP